MDAIQVLSPQTDSQRFLQNQESGLVIQMGQTKWLMYEQRAVPVPVILLTVLIFWLVALFVSFGVFAKPNATLITGLFVSALAVSAAIFLILEMCANAGMTMTSYQSGEVRSLLPRTFADGRPGQLKRAVCPRR